MKIIEENANVTKFMELKAGDVFKSLMTQEVFMKLSSSNTIEVTCDECDNEYEYHLDDYAINLETGEIECFSMLDKVEKCDATLTINN